MVEEVKESGNSRDMLLDAAEALMREQGYAAVTSRRLAAKAGLKPQLVHYYFRTMDDLFLAVFRRLANDIISQQQAAEHSERPLRAMWNVIADTRYRVMIYEFVALANHRKALHGEFVQFGDEIRRMQVRVMERVLAAHDIRDFPWTAGFTAILLHSLARFIALEAELGVSAFHADALRVVNFYIDRFDAPAASGDRIAALEAEIAALRRRLESLDDKKS